MSGPRPAESNHLLEAALSYAQRGWRVVRLHGIFSGVCACGREKCPSAGKHPNIGEGWQNLATTDEATIRRWWAESPDSNVGILTGAESGIIVLDVDVKSDGPRQLAQLEEKNGPLPATLKAKTGSGGFHYYFKHPPGIIASFNHADGLELKADKSDTGGGHQVVAPPSINANGPYEWLTRAELALPPDWLIRRPWRKQREVGEPAAKLHPSERHKEFMRIAGGMWRLGAGEDEIRAAIAVCNQTRCVPPKDDIESEIRGILDDFLVKRPRQGLATDEPEPEPEHGDAWEEPEPEPSIKGLSVEELYAQTSDEIPWVVEPWVTRGGITLLEGKPKRAGKTTFALAMCRAVMESKEFLEYQTHGREIMFFTEQGGTTFRLALERAGIIPFDPKFPIEIFPLHTVAGHKWPDLVKSITKIALQRQALVIIDTLPPFAGIGPDEENDAGAALEAMKPLMEAAAAGIPIIATRHERKAEGEVGDAGRGSNAWTGTADVVVSLRRPAEDQDSSRRELHILSRLPAPDEAVAIAYEAGKFSFIGTAASAKKAAERDRDSSRVQPVKEKIISKLREHGPMGARDLRESCGGTAKYVDSARKTLTEDGLILYDIKTQKWFLPTA